MPSGGTRERTSSWFIIYQRLICQGLVNLSKERLWDNQCELSWAGRGKKKKRGPEALQDPGGISEKLPRTESPGFGNRGASVVRLSRVELGTPVGAKPDFPATKPDLLRL